MLNLRNKPLTSSAFSAYGEMGANSDVIIRENEPSGLCGGGTLDCQT